MKEPKKEMLKQVTCDPMCGFMVRSHDEGEVKKFTIDHVKKVHHKNLAESDVDVETVWT